MKDLHDKLVKRLKNHSRIVFMGIGEEKLSDDGVGPYIISELLTCSNDTILFINGATDPMLRMDEIIKFRYLHFKCGTWDSSHNRKRKYKRISPNFVSYHTYLYCH